MKLFISIITFIFIIWIFPFLVYVMNIPENCWIICPIMITYTFSILCGFIWIIIERFKAMEDYL